MHRLLRQLTLAVKSDERANWLQYLLVLVFLAMATFFLTPSDRLPALDTMDWKQETVCRLTVSGAESRLPTFKVRTISGIEGQSLCASLAKDQGISQHFGQIEVEWGTAAESLRRSIAERSVDLVLLRPDSEGRTDSFLDQLYQKLAYYPSYDVYLIAPDAEPVIESNYLYGRKIGLLAKEESRSGYILPMRLFHRLGLTVSTLDIRYYAGHAELRQAMSRGEVDLIGTYWSARDRTRFPGWHRTRIDQVTEGLNWYLADDHFQNVQARCALVHVLQTLAQRASSDYFSDLRVIKDAHEPCQDTFTP